jgi:hypothetical protein
MGRLRIPFAIAALVAVCGSAFAEFKPYTPANSTPANLTVYEKAASAPDYALASAHAPRFSDRALWPNLSGKEAFLSQKWGEGRLYVWAHPGRSGAGGKGDLDPAAPGNWLLNGKPATELVLDENTDLLFPAADKFYNISFRQTPLTETCRHLTVEANAGFRGGGDGKGRQIFGNVWVKKGGTVYTQGATKFLGGTHTFFRNDNSTEYSIDGWKRAQRVLYAQYFSFNKGEGSTIEFLGYVAVLDEFNVANGTAIVGPDSKLMPGRNASPKIAAGATLALMDNAVFVKWANEFNNRDMDCAGAIQGGLPDRPLTRPAHFFVNFKNHSNSQYNGPGAEVYKGSIVTFPRTPSLILRSTAALRSYSTTPEARLQVDWSGDVISPTWQPPPAAGIKDGRSPDHLARAPWFESLPRGITIYFAKGATVDTVQFDRVLPGGLLLQDMADRPRWRNVTFGPNMSGTEQELLKQAELGRDNTY